MPGFTVYGDVAGKGSGRALVRGGRGVIVPSNSTQLGRWTRDLQRGVTAMLAAGHGPWTGPVRIRVTFTLPRPAGAPVARRPWPHKRGLDLDKACRALLDAIQGPGGLITDDSQVVALVARKVYPDTPGQPDRLEHPGAVVTITPLTEETP